jgi:hypothetical protein
MARTSAREQPERECVLQPEQKSCPVCGAFMRIRYENDRTDELLATSLTDTRRLRRRLAKQGRVILALDGLPRISRMAGNRLARSGEIWSDFQQFAASSGAAP